MQEFRDETSNEIQYPITYKDRTYLPLRTVANLVGIGVDYDSKTNTALLTSNNAAIYKNNIKVIDGITYTVSDLSKERKVSIPQIINAGKNATLLNTKIASELLQDTYKMIDTTDELSSKMTAKYDYKIINDILVISANINYEYYPASGTGKFDYNYFYDIKNDKEIMLYEALPKIGYTISDIQKLGANSFEDFKELEGLSDKNGAWMTYLTIENDNIKIHYKETIA